MQIRLRRTNGELVKLDPDIRFLEILDLDDKLGLVIMAGDQEIKICYPQDADFNRYIIAFPQKTSAVKSLTLPRH